jgi:hypothetical protein
MVQASKGEKSAITESNIDPDPIGFRRLGVQE